MIAKDSLAPWKLLPAAPGTCPQCAYPHEPEYPHNQQSLFWNYHFYSRHGRWPTWSDAMRHCSFAMRSYWAGELERRGEQAYEIYRNWGNPERFQSSSIMRSMKISKP